MRFLSAIRVTRFVVAPVLRALPLACACSVLAVAGCSSSSGGNGSASSSTVTYIPGFEGGTTSGGQSSSQTTTGTSSSGPSGGSSTSTVTGGSSSSSATVIPSSGIVITVIPDGTGDAAGLLSAIQNAKSAVHVEMYLLTNQTYINALISQKKAGIDVKVILNQNFPTGSSSAQTNASSYPALQAGGVDIVWSPTTTGFDNYTHEKTVIIDPGQTGEQAWIMTMNLDTDAPKDNREYLAQDTNSADIGEAESIFEADYAGMDITASGNLVVAPEPPNNCATVLLSLVNGATTSIDMEAEEIDESGSQTESKIFAALVAKAKAGVAVKLVLEDSDESTQTQAVTDLEAAGAKVVGYAYGTGLDIHAKALVADGARAYVGSENFTGGSLGDNRELGVYFETASEVQKVESTIQQDFAAGSTYVASSN